MRRTDRVLERPPGSAPMNVDGAFLVLRHEDTQLILDATRGGGILEFSWRDRPIFRSTPRSAGLDPFALACFPMVPYANRIAHGRFNFGSARRTSEEKLGRGPAPAARAGLAFALARFCRHHIQCVAGIRRGRGRMALALSSRTAFTSESWCVVDQIVDREPGEVAHAGDARTASVFLRPGSGTDAGEYAEGVVDGQGVPAHRRGRHTARLVVRSGKSDHGGAARSLLLRVGTVSRSFAGPISGSIFGRSTAVTCTSMRPREEISSAWSR